MSKPSPSPKPSVKLAAPIPPRATATPPPSASRKSSQPSVNTVKESPKFYKGPTVSATANEVASKAGTVAAEAADRTRVAANKTAAVAKTKKAVSTVQRHPWGFVSLITTIPFLLAISLFSTVFCPPPSEPQSAFSRLVTAHLGLHPPSPHSSLHRTLCYPANVYHREVLQPYIYPYIEQTKANAQAHPLYTRVLEPTYNTARDTSTTAWNGPVKPVVDQVVRGVRRFYLTFVDPHLPYLRAKVDAITAPYTARAAALHNTYIAPRISTAQMYAYDTGTRAADSYRYLASHPVTGQAGKYADAGYRFSRQKGTEAYRWSRPHVVQAGNEAGRIAREVLGPRIVRGIERSADQAGKGLKVVQAFVSRIYYTHLDPHVGPHLARASLAASPYVFALEAKVYSPYIRPFLAAYLPAAVFAPEPSKSFWSLIADFLPAPGSNSASSKGSMPAYYDKLDKAAKPAKVPIPDTGNLGSKASKTPLPPPDESKQDKKAREQDKADSEAEARKEMERVREAIRERVNKQGEKSYKVVKDEIVKLNADFLSESLPKLGEVGQQELNRDIEYILTGIDKLFSSSTSLTKEQVKSAAEMAERRLMDKAGKVKERVELQRRALYEKGKPIVRREFDALDAALGKEYEALKEKMAWMDSVTYKDWEKYQAVQKTASDWKDKFISLHEGKAADRAIKKDVLEIDKLVKYQSNDLNEIVEAFKDRVGILKRTANDRVAARDAVKASPVSSASSSASSGRVSILPIVEAGAAAAGVGAIIGKGKEQVMDALNQASAAVAGETLSTGYMHQARSISDQVVASASSMYDAASSEVHDATRSAIKAVGATPSPEGIQEHAQSVLAVVSDSLSSGAIAISASAASGASEASLAVSSGAPLASKSASSLVADALLNLQHATKSIRSSAGASPSPEGMIEHLKSIADDVARGAASVYGVIEENVHDATRSAIRAVGATPSPDSPMEYAQSFAAEVSGTAASLVAEASVSMGSLASGVSASASLAYSAAGSAVMEAVSTASSAVLAAPSDVVDGAQSLASVASASAESIGSAAPSVMQNASRSALRAVAATPTPEGPAEHLESASAVMSAMAASLLGDAAATASLLKAAASSAVHDGTRSAIKAVGGTPSPETPLETLESIAVAASASASSVFDAASTAASSGYDAASASAASAYSAVIDSGSSGYDAVSASASSAYDVAASAAISAGSAATDQADLLVSAIQSFLRLAPTAAPPLPVALASSASAFLSSLSESGSSLAAPALESGSSLLSALSVQATSFTFDASASISSIASDASTSVHSATRAASRAIGATPATPSSETPSEYVDDVKARIASGMKDAESLVRKHASLMANEAAEATERAKAVVGGRDEL